MDEAGEERKLLSSIKKRKHCWIGHVLRHKGMLKEVMEGRIEGKRGRGRRRLGMLSEMGEYYYELKMEAQDRGKWRNKFVPTMN